MREGTGLFPGNHDFAVYAWVEDADGTIHARMFAPLDGIPEEPATGSAAPPLGCASLRGSRRKPKPDHSSRI
ncbi:PhzF family phenazine biosynthesis protein [uncultured Aliiroseovarius sp.]|uniref:PhzF family phenazine biosynthesis protein n=1 Tax=uncultured Aliiroseovarius sp. TaxID=1658783 RepID=UPI002631EE3D|nr:PhzF family phenazine biosynthesis protein [uncultured Aliiroseovarius sp.]